MFKSKLEMESGQSLFEMVMAIGLVATIAVAIISISTAAVRNSSFSGNKAESNRYAQEAIEWLKGEKERDWDGFRMNVASHQIGTTGYSNICFNNLDWATSATCPGLLAGLFKREGYFKCKVNQGDVLTNCNSVLIDNIEVNLQVYWDAPQGRQETNVVTIFAKGQPI